MAIVTQASNRWAGYLGRGSGLACADGPPDK
jgi:hypothetical protein